MGQPVAEWFTPEVRARYHAAWSQPGEGGSHGLTGGVNYYRASPLHPPSEGTAPLRIDQMPPEAFIVKVPTLVIWGEMDMALPKACSTGWNASFLTCAWSAFPTARTGSCTNNRSVLLR